MKPWLPIEECRSALNLAVIPTASLESSNKDNELQLYLVAAQRALELFTRRAFDGSVERTEYFDGCRYNPFLVLKSYPIVSITTLHDDLDREFDSASLISASDYFLDRNIGKIILKGTASFQDGEKNIKVVYKGGYIPETTVVAAALPANNMTVADALSSYSQAFSLYVQTGTAQVAGSITITGTDENGSAQSEILTFTGTAAQRLLSKKSWKSVTDFDAAAVSTGSNTIKCVGVSFPSDLRSSLLHAMAFLYRQDSLHRIGLTSRNIGDETESGISDNFPKQVLEIWHGYKDYG